MRQPRRPIGKCLLCGKLVWGSAQRFDNGIRHVTCQPGKNGHRYGVADTAKRKG